eukprot:1892866-Prymnesium_polylepis.1
MAERLSASGPGAGATANSSNTQPRATRHTTQQTETDRTAVTPGWVVSATRIECTRPVTPRPHPRATLAVVCTPNSTNSGACCMQTC